MVLKFYRESQVLFLLSVSLLSILFLQVIDILRNSELLAEILGRDVGIFVSDPRLKRKYVIRPSEKSFKMSINRHHYAREFRGHFGYLLVPVLAILISFLS